MNPKALKYLISLEEKGSFTEAAETHFLTQPAISIQLKKLQEDLKARLFEMDGKKVRFTKAGEIALDYARRFQVLEKEFTRELKNMEDLGSGEISIGTVDAASIYVLPNIFSRFMSLYPAINIHLEIDSTIPLIKELKEGKLDIVVGSLPVTFPGDFSISPIYEETLAIIAPPNHPLTRGKKLTPEMIVEYPFISFQKESVTRKIVEDAFEKIGLRPKITMAIDSPEAIKNLVASGLGLAVLPFPIVKDGIEKGTLAQLKLKGLKFERKLGLILPAGQKPSAAVSAFIKVLAEELEVEISE